MPAIMLMLASLNTAARSTCRRSPATGTIVVPAFRDVDWCLPGTDRTSRSGPFSQKCLDRQTDRHTDKHHPANFFHRTPDPPDKIFVHRTCNGKALAVWHLGHSTTDQPPLTPSYFRFWSNLVRGVILHVKKLAAVLDRWGQKFSSYCLGQFQRSHW